MAQEKYKKRFLGTMTENNAAYREMLENLDDKVGREPGKLRELNIQQDTLVILMNDTGALMNNTGATVGASFQMAECEI